MKVTVKPPKEEPRTERVREMVCGQAFTNGILSWIKLPNHQVINTEGGVGPISNFPMEARYTLLPAGTIFEIESN